MLTADVTEPVVVVWSGVDREDGSGHYFEQNRPDNELEVS